MINIVYHCDNKYVRFLLLSIYSIIKHTTQNCVFHVLHNFDREHTLKVQTFLKYYNIPHNLIKVDKDLLDYFNVPENYYRLIKPKATINLYEFVKSLNPAQQTQANFTCPVIFYSLLHKYVFTFSKYIVLDCDTILTTDINNLYQIPFNGKSCCMRRDWSNKTFVRDGIEYEHFNPSVLLTEVELIAEYIHLAFNNMLKTPLTAKFGMQHDVCVLAKNLNQIEELDYYWNFSVLKDKIKENNPIPYLLHFVSISVNEIKFQKHYLYQELIKTANECNISFFI